MTADAFREIALAFDGAVEEHAHMGHPDFRANGRIFAGLHGDERRHGEADAGAAGRVDTGRSESSAHEWCVGTAGRDQRDADQSERSRGAGRSSAVLAWQAVATVPRAKAKARRK